MLATTCVAMRCQCRCWPMPWSSGHRGLFVPSSSSTRATLVHWVACCSDWTLTFSSNHSVCTHLYFYPRIMISFPFLIFVLSRKFSSSSKLPIIAKRSSVTISIFAYYFAIFVSMCLCGFVHVPENCNVMFLKTMLFVKTGMV